MLLKKYDVERKRGIKIARQVGLNIGRAFNAVPNGNKTLVWYEEDRRKAGAPFPLVIDDNYASFVTDSLAYVTGVSALVNIHKFDGNVVDRSQLLAVDNISYVESAGNTKCVVYYEWLGKYELVKIEINLSIDQFIDLINDGSYS